MVGGGDSAIEEATYLTKFASKVYLIHRRDQLRASKIMAQRAADNPKIEILWNKIVVDVLGDEKISALRLRDTRDQKESELPVGGLFLAIGHTPATAFLDGQLELDSKGYIKLADPYRTTTSIEGVFAAGDVWTASTAKPLPPRVWDAKQPSTRNAGSPTKASNDFVSRGLSVARLIGRDVSRRRA